MIIISHVSIFMLLGCMCWVCMCQDLNTIVQDKFLRQGKHVFSVMILERNQSHLLKEFIQHYLEEGADHFFIYNIFGSPSVHKELSCVPASLYTVLPHMPNITRNSKIRQAVYEYVRPKTKWLAVFDSDDYVSSRVQPGRTIREVLEQGILGICDIISIPSISFGWGSVQKTPTGQIRQTLLQRWGYDHKFEERMKNADNSPAVEASSQHRNISHKFSDSFDRVKNKVIVKTSIVDKVRTNSASMRKTGTVCVASSTPTQACVRRAKAALSASGMVQNTTDTEAAVATAASNSTSAAHSALLPKYCPAHNLYRSRRSSSSVYLLEEDIPSLALACHHYRIPSWEEWQKRADRRPEHYREQDAKLANRLDVSDDFMLQREDSRRSHSLFIKAKTTLQACGTSSAATVDTILLQQPSRKERNGEEPSPSSGPSPSTATTAGTGSAPNSGGKHTRTRTSSSESAPLTGIPLVDRLYQYCLYVLKQLEH